MVCIRFQANFKQINMALKINMPLKMKHAIKNDQILCGKYSVNHIIKSDKWKYFLSFEV